MTNTINQFPYLRTSRLFPTEDKPLQTELGKAYIDIANAVNNRIIGIFPTNRIAITGESWYFTSQKQQSLRQLYNLTSTIAFPHGLELSQVPYVSRMWGQFTDGTNWYGLIPGSNVAIAGQVSFYLSNNDVNFLSGAGAPILTKGILVIEYLSVV